VSRGGVAIVGASETGELGRIEASALDLHADAALRAVADAGLSLSDIDGICSPKPLVHDVAHHLALRPRWLDGTMVGGCSAMLHVRHAAAALEAGLCNAVLVSHGESGRSRIGEPAMLPGASSPAGQFEVPHGSLLAPANFTVPAMRFLHDRGMSQRDLAHVVVAQREWAARNPRAGRRDLVSTEDVLAAPMIAYPFTRPMCCLVTDGGGALIMVRSERVSDLQSAAGPVYLRGAAETVDSSLVSQMPDVSSFGAFQRVGAEALAEARMSVGDLDHLMIYDAFAHLPLYGLEALGIVDFGKSGAFIADGHTSPGGRLPMNTNGGGLSYTHTGTYGMFAIQEAVRQLRGTAAAQVPDVQASLVLGVGWYFAAAGALVLSGSPN
jgi:acetyl-CoA acetyltransferase